MLPWVIMMIHRSDGRHTGRTDDRDGAYSVVLLVAKRLLIMWASQMGKRLERRLLVP